MDLEKLLARWREIKYTKTISIPEFPNVDLSKINISRRGLGKVTLGIGAAVVLLGISYEGCKLLSSAGEAVADTVSGNSLDDYLPEGFKGLEMEMSYQEVQKIRPFIKTTGEEGEAFENLNERTKKKFFEFFGYKVQDNREGKFTFFLIPEAYAQSAPAPGRAVPGRNAAEQRLYTTPGSGQYAKPGFAAPPNSFYSLFHSGKVVYDFGEDNKLDKMEFEFRGGGCTPRSVFDTICEKAKEKFGDAPNPEKYCDWNKNKTVIRFNALGNDQICRLLYSLEKK